MPVGGQRLECVTPVTIQPVTRWMLTNKRTAASAMAREGRGNVGVVLQVYKGVSGGPTIINV